MEHDPLATSQLTDQDRRLLDRLIAGDEAAAAEIDQRFGQELRLFCRRMLGDAAGAEDIVQDVFCTCCKVGPESLPTRSVRAWLYQIARRRCIDVRRRQNRTGGDAAAAVRRVQPGFDNAIDPLTTPAGKALKRDRAAKLLALLDDLDDDLRTVVVMRYFQNLPRDEIAEAVGLTLAGTKARLSKAMDLLRDKLTQLDDSGT
ncbi:ECF RNA polymerase sigma factor SigW [Phycisphaerae bacterium RAS1]|nr:ECF RNA polymerase sigma factor SigW [Phycisphaerae bacterium RAS1]